MHTPPLGGARVTCTSCCTWLYEMVLGDRFGRDGNGDGKGEQEKNKKKIKRGGAHQGSVYLGFADDNKESML